MHGQEKYDGFELMLQNVKNLTIRGSGKVNTTLEMRTPGLPASSI